MAKIPIAYKKTIKLLEELGYVVSDEPAFTKEIDNMYIDADGNLVVVTDE